MWRIKDPEIKAKVNQFFTDEEIDVDCNFQMENDSDFICSSLGEGDIELRIQKNYFEKEAEYQPDDWNQFPEVKPPRSGLYFVYLNEAWEQRLALRKYEETNNRNKWSGVLDREVIAFKECHEEGPREIKPWE